MVLGDFNSAVIPLTLKFGGELHVIGEVVIEEKNLLERLPNKDLAEKLMTFMLEQPKHVRFALHCDNDAFTAHISKED